MFRILLGALIATAPLCSITAKASILEQMSDEFNRIATKAMPATVYIKVEIQGQQQQFDPFQDDFLRRFFGGSTPQQPPQPQMGGGSGFIIRPDGYIVTNNHVIKDASQITVLLNDGRECKATVKGADARTDLAVLKIEEKDLPYLVFGDSDALRVGEIVIAIGNPFGLEASLTTGVVSAKGRQDLGIAAFEDFIQTDAAINLGNSGGPLLNPQGEVIGVNTAILSRTGENLGISLSIPSKMAQYVIDQIIDGGCVKRAYLGIIMQPVDKDFAEAQGLDKQDGLLISEVIKGSPADKAGIQNGDIILAYNDKPIKSITKFRNEIGMMAPATEIKLRILRNGAPIQMTLALGSASESEVVTGEMLQKLGIEIDNVTAEQARKYNGNEQEGVIITSVKQGSPAANAGLSRGFVITHVAFDKLNNQRKISNVDDFTAAMKEAVDKKYLILIARQQNYQRYYTIKIN